jgi:hypothetical protein
VSYTTIIDVPNEGGRLKPGMTATLNIEVERLDNVLRVPASAVRFRPSEEVLMAFNGTSEMPEIGGNQSARGGDAAPRQRFAARPAHRGNETPGAGERGGLAQRNFGQGRGGFPGRGGQGFAAAAGKALAAAERRTKNEERRTQHRTQNAEHRTQKTKDKGQRTKDKGQTNSRRGCPGLASGLRYSLVLRSVLRSSFFVPRAGPAARGGSCARGQCC